MDAARMLLEMIIQREGFGDLLAEGIRMASNKIGKGSVEAAMHVKGLELPGHDTRSKDGGKVWAIQYGTAGRGMCHVHPHEPVVVHACNEQIPDEFKDIEDRENPYSEKGRGKMVKWAQDYGNAINALGLCNFHSYLIPGSDPFRYTKILRAVSGWDIDFKELLEIGERVSNIQRCFNVREGIRRKDDYIPKRLMRPPAFGPFSSRPETEIQNYNAMLDEYYAVRGWDKETGIPTPEKLNQLGLEPIENSLP
jgi:aldehyde:ferredoxin oxidoreductase